MLLADGVTIEAAFELRSSDSRFGGLSGIIVEPERMLLVSDRSSLWTAVRPAGGDIAVPLHWEVQRLIRDGRSRPDSESLALRPDGTVVIGLEGEHALLELPPSGGWRMGALPPPLRAAPANEGIEALTTLADGNLLALVEGSIDDDGRHLAMVLDGGKGRTLGYHARSGYKPTGADRSGDWLFVTERQMAFPLGLSARVTAIRLADGRVPDNGLPEPIELARMVQAGSTDNIEGIAAEPGSDPGSYRLWLVTDDNFSMIQRTLLLVLSWRPGPVPALPQSDP